MVLTSLISEGQTESAFPFYRFCSYQVSLGVVRYFFELALVDRGSKDAGVFFFRRPFLDCRPRFLAETVETGDKKRDDLRCMQTRDAACTQTLFSFSFLSF